MREWGGEGGLVEDIGAGLIAQRAHLLRRLGEEARARGLLRGCSLPPTASRAALFLAAAAASGAATRAALRAADAAVGEGRPLGAVALARQAVVGARGVE